MKLKYIGINLYVISITLVCILSSLNKNNWNRNLWKWKISLNIASINYFVNCLCHKHLILNHIDDSKCVNYSQFLICRPFLTTQTLLGCLLSHIFQLNCEAAWSLVNMTKMYFTLVLWYTPRFHMMYSTPPPSILMLFSACISTYFLYINFSFVQHIQIHDLIF